MLQLNPALSVCLVASLDPLQYPFQSLAIPASNGIACGTRHGLTILSAVKRFASARRLPGLIPNVRFVADKRHWSYTIARQRDRLRAIGSVQR